MAATNCYGAFPGGIPSGTFITNNGRRLVRIGTTTSTEPSGDYLAIAFYEEGKLIKKYGASELVKYPDKVHQSTSLYHWLKPSPAFDAETETVSLVTSENTKYTFVAATGKILSKE